MSRYNQQQPRTNSPYSPSYSPGASSGQYPPPLIDPYQPPHNPPQSSRDLYEPQHSSNSMDNYNNQAGAGGGFSQTSDHFPPRGQVSKSRDKESEGGREERERAQQPTDRAFFLPFSQLQPQQSYYTSPSQHSLVGDDHPLDNYLHQTSSQGHGGSSQGHQDDWGRPSMSRDRLISASSQQSLSMSELKPGQVIPPVPPMPPYHQSSYAGSVVSDNYGYANGQGGGDQWGGSAMLRGPVQSGAGWGLARENMMRRRDVRQVELKEGNLVLDVPVPAQIIPPGNKSEEMNKMR